MSEPARERAIARLAQAGAVLAPIGEGLFGVFSSGDRRRRPAVRLRALAVRELEAEGVIEGAGSTYTLTPAGRARAVRQDAEASERFLAQHAPLANRKLVDDSGAQLVVRGLAASVVMKRLSQLRDGAGAPWLTASELGAAEALRRDWELAQRGLTRGIDLAAPQPAKRGGRAGNAVEAAMARRCDAHRRVSGALASIAPPLRRVVERVCLLEQGLESIERAEGWPPRSGKLALKLGLAQLAVGLAA